MNKVKIAKTVARIVVGTGTTTVSNSIIRNNVEPRNIAEQICVGVASVVIGSMASEATKSHTDARIDELVEALKQVNTTVQEEPTSTEDA